MHAREVEEKKKENERKKEKERKRHHKSMIKRHLRKS